MYLQLLYITQRGELIQFINKITIKDEAIDQVGESSILSLTQKQQKKEGLAREKRNELKRRQFC